ncbi:transcription factor Adf-1 [Elysia marginata]|uniref:Transcription factor Adf-1 n=1 Tax=Elysia marginata TaxID=1093978 RepID=A0AAV4H919_9GAST|nr:transcription factor Adf-1 [Elysia marginata]
MYEQTVKDFSVRLIKEVELRNCLYDKNNPYYKDSHEHAKAWYDVGVALGIPHDKAKRRWQNLRGSYSRSRGKSNVSFYLAPYMAFLEPHIQQPSSFSAAGAINSKQEPLDQDCEDDQSDMSLPLRSPPSSPSPSLNSQPEDHSITLNTERLSGAASKRKRVHSAGVVEDSLEVSGKNYSHSTQNFANSSIIKTRVSKKKSPASKYLKGLIPQVELLSKRNQWNYFQKISTLLFQTLAEQEEEDGTKREDIHT